MQVAKGPYKCVPRQLRMTCELRSSARADARRVVHYSKQNGFHSLEVYNSC